jgi:hypothetical protein
MDDKRRLDQPRSSAGPARPRARGAEVWRVSKDGRVISGELRDESRTGAGWDVIIRQRRVVMLAALRG